MASIRQWAVRAWDALRGRGQAASASQQGYAAFMSMYAEPNAEKVRESYHEFASVAYAGNSIIFGLVRARLSLFSEARFKFRNLSTKRLFGDPGLALLETPWPNGSTGELLARMEQDASLAGNAYVRDTGDGRLERLRPDWVTIVSVIRFDVFGRQLREVIGYAYEPTGDPDRDIEFYPVDEVAHWSPIPDPLANWRGMSWLTPVVREINADLAMTEHRDAYFRNAATPNMVIKYSKKLGPGLADKIRDEIAARHTGPSNSFSTMVLDEGADLTVVGSALNEAAFSLVQAAGENRIAVAAGVPAIVAGLKEGLAAATMANYGEAMEAFANLTMRPNWRSACAALAKLVTVPAGAELWFDTTDIAALQQGEQEAAATMAQQAVVVSTLITAGYEPGSVVDAVTAGDLTLLKHTGLVSVQLLQPGAQPAPAPTPAGGG